MDRRQYLKHFTLLFSGTAAAQAANLLSYPFLARLYSPVDFGGFAIFVAASSIPAAIACARFDLAIPTAPDHGRFAIMWLSFSVAAVAAVASGAVSMAYWLAMGTPDALVLAALLTLAVGVTGFCNATILFLMRHGEYRLTSASVFARTAAAVVAQLTLAFLLRDSRGLILGYCAGLVAQATLLLPPLARLLGRSRPRIKPMRAMAARYRKQVSADIPGTLVGALALYATPFVIQFLYGAASVGFYAVGQRIAVLPLQLFNDSLAQIFFQKASHAHRERGSFWRETKFNLLLSAVPSLGMLLVILALARPFITFYLGAKWEPAATILMILAPMLAIRSITMSIATVVFVVKKAHWLLLHNVASISILIAAFGLAFLSSAPLNMFLTILAVLSGIEFAGFGLILINAARRQTGNVGRSPTSGRESLK